MTRCVIWILLTLGGVVAAFFALCEWRTAAAAAAFGGLYLAAHALFGEDA